MKFRCPHCDQSLQADESQAGHAIQCPSCRQSMRVPQVAGNGTASSAKGRRPGGAVRAGRPAARRGGGSGKFLWMLVLLAAVAFGYAMHHFHESPQQVWQRVLAQFVKPEPAPAPAPVAPPAPEPEVVPPPEVAATPAPEPEPVPEAPEPAPVDPFAWLLEHKAYWPKEVTLREGAEFPILYNGEVAGAAALPPGTKVGLAGLEPEALTVSYGGGSKRLAVDATDLRELAVVAMKKAEAAAAKAAERAAAAAASAPAAPEETMDPDDSVVVVKGVFVHPGLLHNEEDFDRMRKNKSRQPWKGGWEKLLESRFARLDYKPAPLAKVVRGQDRLHTEPQNYQQLYRDIAAAYACALRWRVSGDRQYAEKSIEILNAWSSTLKELGGSTDVCLAAGIYGYQFANAGEIMRTYKGWKPEEFARFQKMMVEVFLPINQRFLDTHNGTQDNHYWANWDLCNMASMMAIGVLCDKKRVYNEAVRYFKRGNGMGAVKNAVYHVHPGGLGQWQESGRDQGHTVMGIGLMGTICEMAWKQGDDLYGYDNNRFLAGCEYVAKYNLGEEVPFKPYTNDKYTMTQCGDVARGNIRPVWELVYNHYVKRRGLSAPYTTKMAEKARPEGGGGDYGPNSGGFDHLGWGTLVATLEGTNQIKPANRRGL